MRLEILDLILDRGLKYGFFYFSAASMKVGTSRYRSSSNKYQEMVRQLKEYMHHLQLQHALQQKILLYYEFRFRKSYFRESEILSSVSGTLRQVLFLHSEFFHRDAFFFLLRRWLCTIADN